MKTVILKWNPNFSSYSMYRYLDSLVNANFGNFEDYNWSVWDHDQIHEGDRFYWVKLGHGQVGIVGAGIITSNPYEGEDWSGKGRPTFYVDFMPDVLINPDALPILTAETLSKHIPDFEWDRGHSGLVLNPEQAKVLEKLWADFLDEHRTEFEKKAYRDGWEENDRMYWGIIE